MASPSGSLDTSANSYPQTSFSFSTTHPFMTSSFSDLLASADDEPVHNANNNNTDSYHRRGLADRIAERTGSGVPKFKSIPPPSLPISPPAVSPSSYFAIPPGLSPAELLDSPVLLNTSNVSLYIQHVRYSCYSYYYLYAFGFFTKQRTLLL